MQIAVWILQVIVAFSLFNVWLLRFERRTAFRGGGAQTMPEEFAAYGLPKWFMWLVGALKMSVAVSLLAGLWIHALVLPAAALLVVLMLGALAMHLKVRDPGVKAMPALLMLAMSLAICWGATH